MLSDRHYELSEGEDEEIVELVHTESHRLFVTKHNSVTPPHLLLLLKLYPLSARLPKELCSVPLQRFTLIGEVSWNVPPAFLQLISPQGYRASME